LLSLEKAQADFRAALCDSFNTPVALDVLRDLVSKTNVYINSSGKALNVGVVTRVARWVGDMLRMFGLGEGPSAGGGDRLGARSVKLIGQRRCESKNSI
jgi:cysteinyl-tRNA synthetase